MDALPIYLCISLILSFKGLIPSLTLQQHRVSLQRQKREQNMKEQREQERNSPAKKKSSAASSLLCAKKSNKRKRLNSPFKRGWCLGKLQILYFFIKSCMNITT